MNIDEDLQRICRMDQTGAAMRNMAEMIAVFWKTLTENGVLPEYATELTMPLVIKFLGGDPSG